MKVVMREDRFDYPEFKMKCNQCQGEYDLIGDYADADDSACPYCESKDVENLYISFSFDGPGFDKNYNPSRLTEACGGDIENDSLDGTGCDESNCGSCGSSGSCTRFNF
jgi:predicted nucleic acid-binding Zn ribbon protein